MRAICVDDEVILLRVLEKMLENSPDIDSVAKFSNGEAALEYARNNPVDIAFLDIEIGSINGIELSTELRKIHPKMYVIFCTGYETYALDAFRVHANGYLTKPIDPKAVQEQIDNIKLLSGNDEKKLIVRCFGNFEVYHNGKPVVFKRNKSKELFAYLVDKQGALVPSGQIAAALWEDTDNDKNTKNNFYQAYHQLKADLAELGFQDALVKKINGYAANVKMLDCDYYRLLNHEINVFDLLTTEYMIQYSWAEETNAALNMKKL